MASTTRIKKIFFRSLYAILLLVLFGFLVLLFQYGYQIYRTNIDAKNTYNEYLNERDQLVESYNEVKKRYNQRQANLEEAVDLETRGSILNNSRRDLAEASILITTVIEYNNKITLLNIAEELKSPIYDELVESESEKGVIEQNQKLVEYQIALNNYYIAEKASNICFNTVNFSGANSTVIAQIDTCIPTIANMESTLLNHYPSLPTTAAYISIQKAYWESQKALYAAIEGGDQTQVAIAQSNLDREKAEIESLFQASKIEIANRLTLLIENAKG